MKKGKYTESELSFLRKHINDDPEKLALTLDRPTTGVKVTIARLRAETDKAAPSLTPEQQEVHDMLLPLLGEPLATYATLTVPDEQMIDAVETSMAHDNKCALTGAPFSEVPFDLRSPYYDDESKLFITALANKARAGHSVKAFAEFCKVVAANFRY